MNQNIKEARQQARKRARLIKGSEEEMDQTKKEKVRKRASEAFEFDGWNEKPVCEMYLPDNDQTREPHAIACNVNGIIDMIDWKQVCVYALGIMCCVNPKFANTLPDHVAQTGFNIRTIRLPSQAEEYAVNLDEIETLDTASYLALFGFTSLLLFKTPDYCKFRTLICYATEYFQCCY